MDVLCPKGHHSTDPDYCSECGAKIDSAPSALATAGSTTPADADACPDCGTKRVNGTALFCEVCRYNFESHQSWTVPAVTPAPAVEAQPAAVPTVPQARPSASSAAPAVPSGEFVGWEAMLTVDGSLYTEPDPSLPLPNEPERTYPLDLAESLIGRRSDRRDIHPEININDSGVSHRHAKLLREPNGTITLLDVGSTNGTRLNGLDVVSGVRTPVTDGDQITLGYWTRIVIRGRRS